MSTSGESHRAEPLSWWRHVVGGVGGAALLSAGWDAASALLGGNLKTTQTAEGALIAAALGGSLGLLLCLWWWLARVVMRGRLTAQGLMGITPLAIAAGWLGWSLLSGKGISEHEHILLMRIALLILIAVVAWVVGSLINRWAFQPGRRVLNPLVPLTLAIGCGIADRLVFPGLYPRFHVGLVVGLVTLGWLFGLVLIRRRSVARLALPLLGLILWGYGGYQVATGRLPGKSDDLRQALLSPRTLPVASRLQALVPPAWIWDNEGELDQVAAANIAYPDPIPKDTLDRLVPQRRSLDVVLVTLDAVRADALGYMGHSVPTSPNIDALARNSGTFHVAIAPYSSSQLSMASLFQGRYPTATDIIERRDIPPLLKEPLEFPPLAHVLSEQGFHTAGLCALPRTQIETHFPFLKQGFADFRANPDPASRGSWDGKGVTDAALEILSTWEPDRQELLWVHYFDPHDPYDHRTGVLPAHPEASAYETEIAYTDRHFQRLLERLKQGGQWDHTVLIIHGDHGEEFGEHGGHYHGTTLYQEQVHVPLIIHIPGAPPAETHEPVSLVDIVPTIAELLGVEIPHLQGQSLLRDLFPSLEPAPRPRAALCEFREPRVLTPSMDAVVTSNLKLILDNRTGNIELYDLHADPREATNLAGQRSQEQQHLLALLKALKQRASTGKSGGATGEEDRLLEAVAGDDATARLRATQRLLVRGNREALVKATEILLNSEDPEAHVLGLRNYLVAPDSRLGPRTLELCGSQDDQTAALACIALSAFKEGAASPALTEVLGHLRKSERPSQAMGASIALGLRGDTDQTAHLEVAAEMLTGEARLMAQLALARLGDIRQLELRRSILSSASPLPPVMFVALRSAMQQQRTEDLFSLYTLHGRPGGSTDWLQPHVILSIAKAWPQDLAAPFVRRALRRRSTMLRQRATKLLGQDLMERPFKGHPMALLYSQDPTNPERAASALTGALKRCAEESHLEWGLLFEALANHLRTERTDRIPPLLQALETIPLSPEDVQSTLMQRLAALARLQGLERRIDLKVTRHDPHWLASDLLWACEVELSCPEESAGLFGGAYSGLMVSLDRQTSDGSWRHLSETYLPPEGVLPGESVPLLIHTHVEPSQGPAAKLRVRLVDQQHPNQAWSPRELSVPVR